MNNEGEVKSAKVQELEAVAARAAGQYVRG